MGEETAPPAAFRPVFQVLLRLARGFKGQFALVSIYAFLSTGADLLQPLVYRMAINDFVGGTSKQPEKSLEALLTAVGMLFVLSVTGYFFWLRSDYRAAYVASRMEAALIQSTFGHVLRLPLSFFTHQPSAGLAKRIDQSDQLSPLVHAFSQQIAPEAIRLVGITAIMFSQSWKMAAVAMCLLPLYILIARKSALRLQTGLTPYYEMWENISSRITDALGAIKTVKLSGAEDRESERLRLESTDAYDIYLHRIRTAQRYYFAQSFLSHLSKALLLSYGGWQVLTGQLTPGDVIMFVAYLDRLYSPIDSLNSIVIGLQQNIASLDRAVRLLETGPLEPTGDDLVPGPGKVEFSAVHFGYTSDREVLKGLELTLEPGKITALAGPSGAGKTTTVDLLMKLWDPSSGEVWIDGQPLSKLDPAAVRRAIGVVATDGAVFRGSLAENIRYKRPDATDAEVTAAALAAGLGRALDRLPQGIATEIGERGIGLSMGERQRLQIARILVDRPRLLILDEATANLDFATELEVKKALSALSPKPTMLVIAHRYSMLQEADYVYILNEGRVEEQGTPEHLLSTGGWFAQMAAQSSGSEPE